MSKWVDVTNTFSDKSRYYKNLFLEICEVYDNVVELSLFTSTEEPYEIYFSYDIFYGIVYVEATTAHEKFSEMKKELEIEYRKNKKATNKFINNFASKHDVKMPNDIFFDFNLKNFI